jgi:hypothetical protein
MYNAHGHKLRVPVSEKAQFVTALRIQPHQNNGRISGEAQKRLVRYDPARFFFLLSTRTFLIQ